MTHHQLWPRFMIVQLNAFKIYFLRFYLLLFGDFFIAGLWPRSNDRILKQQS